MIICRVCIGTRVSFVASIVVLVARAYQATEIIEALDSSYLHATVLNFMYLMIFLQEAGSNIPVSCGMQCKPQMAIVLSRLCR